MNENGSDNTSENKESSSSPWKLTRFDDEWARYDEAVEYDPLLGEKLRPADGYLHFNGFKHTVKINNDGTIVIYRKRSLSKTSNGIFDYKKQSNSFKEFGRVNGLSNQVHVDNLRPRRKVNVKMVKLEEFIPDKDWEIDDVALCVVRDEPYVVLVQWEVITTS